MSVRSIPTAVRPNDRQFVSDLSNLFRRHKVRCGDPSDLEHLSAELEMNGRLCQDLFLLCTAISHMSEEDLSPEELLDLIIRAVGGPRAFADGTAEVSPETRSAFVDRYCAWLGRTTQDSSIRSMPRMESDQEEVPWQAQETPFARAAALSRTSEASNGQISKRSGSQRSVSPETAIGDLTLRELSEYLIQLENRVKRAEAYLTPAQAALAAAPAIRHAAEQSPFPAPELLPEPEPEVSKGDVSPGISSGPQGSWEEPAYEEQLVETNTDDATLDQTRLNEAIPNEPKLNEPALNEPMLGEPQRDGAQTDEVLSGCMEDEDDPLAAETPHAIEDIPTSKRPFPGVAMRLDPPLEPVGVASAYEVAGSVREPRVSSPRAYEDNRRSRKSKTISYPTAAVFALALLGGAALGYRFMVAPAATGIATKAAPELGSQSPSREGGSADIPSATGPAMQLSGSSAKVESPRTGVASQPGSQGVRPTPPKLPGGGSDVEMQPTSTPETALLTPSAGPATKVPQPVLSEIVPAPITRANVETPPAAASRQVIESFTQRSSAAGSADGPSRAPGQSAGVMARADVPKSPAALAPAPANPPNVLVVSVPSSTLMRNALSIPGPKYPLGRHVNSDSSVVVRATISKEGRVISATAVSGAADLRISAQSAIMQWRFKPYLVDGKPAEVVTAVTFMFKAH